MKPRSLLAGATLLAFLITQGIYPVPAFALRPSVEGVQSGLEEKLTGPKESIEASWQQTGVEEQGIKLGEKELSGRGVRGGGVLGDPDRSTTKPWLAAEPSFHKPARFPSPTPSRFQPPDRQHHRQVQGQSYHEYQGPERTAQPGADDQHAKNDAGNIGNKPDKISSPFVSQQGRDHSVHKSTITSILTQANYSAAGVEERPALSFDDNGLTIKLIINQRNSTVRIPRTWEYVSGTSKVNPVALRKTYVWKEGKPSAGELIDLLENPKEGLERLIYGIGTAAQVYPVVAIGAVYGARPDLLLKLAEEKDVLISPLAIHNHPPGFPGFPSTMDFEMLSGIFNRAFKVIVPKRNFIYDQDLKRVLEFGISDTEAKKADAIQLILWNREGTSPRHIELPATDHLPLYQLQERAAPSGSRSYFEPFDQAVAQAGITRVKMVDSAGRWVQWNREVEVSKLLLAAGIASAGLEERPAVVAVQTSEISRRVGLANFLDWLPAEVKVVVLDAAGSTVAEELQARRPNMRRVRGSVVDWAVALAGLEENEIIFVGDLAAARQLQRIVPSPMRIIQASGLEEILMALGFPLVAEQIDASGGLEGLFAQARAA